VPSGDISELSMRSICDNIIPSGVLNRARARDGGRREGSGCSASIVQPSGEIDTAGKRDKVTYKLAYATRATHNAHPVPSLCAVRVIIAQLLEALC
jgi:hypothetical protein